MANDLKQQMITRMQGAASLNLAFVGVVNGLFDALHRLGPATPEALAAAAEVDAGYVRRWCDAAYAFELLETDGDDFRLSETGDAFRADAEGTLMPFAVQAVLGAHMAERAAGLMASGERPGEKVLAERNTILPFFGPMLEKTFGAMFEEQILPNVPIFEEVDEKGGLAVDLGCGNGWYLRALCGRCPGLRGVGLDGFDEHVRQATDLAAAAGLGDRLRFSEGDIHDFRLDEPADLIAMNRALHHVWDGRDKVMRIIADHLAPGGAAVIWEPRWPDERSSLRHPRTRGMAFQNLAEHIQGNHFLRPEEVAEAMRGVGLTPEIHTFAGGNEAVIVGRKLAD
ncbi:MAG: class I SAM-dependent methyltransferase [Deltaproteobacteria bacterium]|nr:class I SAM-dependent methyltransferase [Deltaproteobacteria bacterium]